MSFSSSNQVQISKNTLVSIFNTIEPSISFSKTYNENDTVSVSLNELGKRLPVNKYKKKLKHLTDKNRIVFQMNYNVNN